MSNSKISISDSEDFSGEKSIYLDAVIENINKFVNLYKVKKGDSILEYSYRYVRSIELARELEIHSEGIFPEDLIGNNAPCESDQELEWRKMSFASFTKSPLNRLIKAMSSIYHGVYIETKDDEFKRYISDGYPNYSGLNEYFAEVVSDVKALDPNAVAFVTLEDLPSKDTESYEPIVALLNSEDVLEINKYYFLGITSRSIELINSEHESDYSGLEFVFIDDTSEYRITQTGKKEQYNFDIIKRYDHKRNRLPAYQLKGVPRNKKQSIIWESFFQDCVPYLNTVIVESSTLSTIIRRTGYPTRSYFSEECDYQGCEGNGWIMEDELKITCPKCTGSGKKHSFTPFTDFVHTPPERLTGGKEVPFPGLTWVSPPFEPMEFIDKHIDKLIERAGESVNFDLSRKRPGAVTATESLIDQGEWYKTAIKFATQIYDIEDYVIEDIAWIRMRKKIEYTLIRRSEFSIKNLDQITKELKDYRDVVPQFFNYKLINSLVQLRFSDDKRMLRLLEICEYIDPLLGKEDNVAISLIGRTVSETQGIIHFQFMAILNQIENEKKEEFIYGDIEKVKEEFYKIASLVVVKKQVSLSPEDILKLT